MSFCGVEIIYFPSQHSFMIIQEIRTNRLIGNNGDFYLSKPCNQIGWKCFKSALFDQNKVRQLIQDGSTIKAMSDLLTCYQGIHKLVVNKYKQRISSNGAVCIDYCLYRQKIDLSPNQMLECKIKTTTTATTSLKSNKKSVQQNRIRKSRCDNHATDSALDLVNTYEN